MACILTSPIAGGNVHSASQPQVVETTLTLTTPSRVTASELGGGLDRGGGVPWTPLGKTRSHCESGGNAPYTKEIPSLP